MKQRMASSQTTTRLAGASMLLLTAFVTQQAKADDLECTAAIADWQPKSAVLAMAAAKGWAVQRLKTDDGCYQLKVRDAKGRDQVIKVDPSSLQVLETERPGEGDADDGIDNRREDEDGAAKGTDRAG